jgi:hypothetical protein
LTITTNKYDDINKIRYAVISFHTTIDTWVIVVFQSEREFVEFGYVKAHVLPDLVDVINLEFSTITSDSGDISIEGM